MNSLYFRTFIAGSSFPVTCIPLLYMGIATTLTPDSGLHYFYEVLSICILFGLLNILFISIKSSLPFSDTGKYWFFGGCHGLFFSLLWNFWLWVPEKLFHLSGWTQYLTIPVAIILYGCIWRFLVRRVNRVIGVEK